MLTLLIGRRINGHVSSKGIQFLRRACLSTETNSGRVWLERVKAAVDLNNCSSGSFIEDKTQEIEGSVRLIWCVEQCAQCISTFVANPY